MILPALLVNVCYLDFLSLVMAANLVKQATHFNGEISYFLAKLLCLQLLICAF